MTQNRLIGKIRKVAGAEEPIIEQTNYGFGDHVPDFIQNFVPLKKFNKFMTEKSKKVL